MEEDLFFFYKMSKVEIYTFYNIISNMIIIYL